MKKNYEKPIVEVIDFEIAEDFLQSGELPDISGDEGIDEW